MTSILLTLENEDKFLVERVKAILSKLPGVSRLEEPRFVGACLEAIYDFAEDSTIVRLTPDLETIEISGTGNASLNAVLEIQRSYGHKMRLFDTDYSFDIPIDGGQDLSLLRKIINDAAQ